MSDNKELNKRAKTLYKSMPADFTTSDNGSISGYFAIFARQISSGVYEGQIDSYGDIVDPHCFDNTIKRRREIGKPWPLLYSHDWDQIIGRVTDIRPDSEGAFFTAEFFPTERAQEVRAWCLSGTIFQFSWSYSTIKQSKVKLTDGSTANCLQDVELYEVTITGIPAETRTHITDIKKTQAEQKSELLASIYAYQAEERYKRDQTKGKLLRAIHEARISTKEGKLAYLREIEAQAVNDITVLDDPEQIARRRSALAEIRKEIAETEGLK